MLKEKTCLRKSQQSLWQIERRSDMKCEQAEEERNVVLEDFLKMKEKIEMKILTAIAKKASTQQYT